MCWQRQAIGCHGSCDGDWVDLRFEAKKSAVMGYCAVFLCCARGGEHCACVSSHTCVLQTQAIGGHGV